MVIKKNLNKIYQDRYDNSYLFFHLIFRRLSVFCLYVCLFSLLRVRMLAGMTHVEKTLLAVVERCPVLHTEMALPFRLAIAFY
jgi:hypothetical protein